MVAAAPVPSNELARLDSLYNHHILDTPPDERFDLFTRMSTWLFNVPVAAINFIDADRTFFKSLVGFPPYSPVRSTSMCAHAVGGEEAVMVVEDLANDNRFQDHPLVVARGMRFYAGMVLHAESGHRLGTLCLGDVQPRNFSGDDRQKLIELGKGVGAVLEMHRSSRWLLKAASEDILTGLCNRRLFTEMLQGNAARANTDHASILLYLDLDGFKQVNDTLGHAGGDALLREVARRLVRTVRTGDIVARLGGDEFAILMSGPATMEKAEQMAQRILAVFSEPFAFEGKAAVICGSIGIALPSIDAADANSLMRCADKAMYQAKQAGRGQYQVYRTGQKALQQLVM